MFTCLSEQLLEVRDTDPVVATHGGNRRGDTYAGEFVSNKIDLFGACRDQTHGATDMRKNVVIEQLDEECVKIGVDKTRL